VFGGLTAFLDGLGRCCEGELGVSLCLVVGVVKVVVTADPSASLRDDKQKGLAMAKAATTATTGADPLRG
jgi:hypothetical protein